MTDSTFDLTIGLTSYNYAQFIRQAIESVLRQSCPSWRLVIYDNGSTDGTHEIVQTYLHDPRIKLVVREENIGARANFIESLRSPGTRFCSVLQADDFLEPCFVADAKEAFAGHPDLPFVFFDWRQYIHTRSKLVPHRISPLSPFRKGQVRVAPFVLAVGNFIPSHMIVFRSDCLDPFLDALAASPLHQLMEPYLLSLLEDAHGPGGYTGSIGGAWRRHAKQVTQQHLNTSVSSIEDSIMPLWYLENAPAPTRLHASFALLGLVYHAGHTDFLGAVDWLLEKGHPCMERFRIAANATDARDFRISAMTVAMKYSAYTGIRLIKQDGLDRRLPGAGFPATAQGLRDLLETARGLHGDEFLNVDEIGDILGHFRLQPGLHRPGRWWLPRSRPTPSTRR